MSRTALQTRRLATGGLLDRNQVIEFEFNGQQLTGYAGDTLASALLANNISLVARSLKYHRPRGILSAGLEEPSALLCCTDAKGVFIPNLKATEVTLKPGLKAHSQNCWPSVSLDLGAVLQLGSAILTAGFYYKTFKWPEKWWFQVYERIIRRAAGQGKVSPIVDTKIYDKRQLHCDTLVVGSGPKGIAASIDAAQSGVQVLLIEQDHQLGGSGLWQNPFDGLAPDLAQLAQTLDKLAQFPNIQLKTNTLAFGLYDHGLILAVEQTTPEQKVTPVDSIYWRIRANNIVMATGAIEQPVIFPNNDRPGIMLAAAVRQYIYRYAVRLGQKAFLAISNTDERNATAAALSLAGIEVVGSLFENETIVGVGGKLRVENIQLLSSEGNHKTLSCDLICVSSGWVPCAHLSAQLGDKAEFQSAYQRLAESGKQHLGPAKAFVDLQNDVTRADLELAMREGYDHVELAKRYTTTGMGTDQGKTSWPNAIQEIARIVNKPAEQIGTTTFRPPYSPVSFSALVGADVGQNLAPTRHTPFYRAFKQVGCVFQTSGNWIYSRYFPMPGETMAQSIRREVLAVRNHLGCVDMSTLGKVDAKGKDALTFLSRIYCNNIDSIQPGKLRYALMLREDGILFDDGTVAQLGEQHFLVTMTTANAGACWHWMQKLLQVQWPELDVQITSVTDHWASLAISGPESRKLLAKLKPSFEIDKENFPFASVREGLLDSTIPCRIFSVSFSGELSYEINVPAAYASVLFDWALELGKAFGMTPYGLETLDVLRIEKGHLSIGTEIDGRTTPADLGLGKMVSSKKNFIGQALLQRPVLQQLIRAQLVGLIAVDGLSAIPPAAVITENKWQPGEPQDTVGKITAAVESPILGYSIALALIDNGFQRIGQRLWAVSAINNLAVEVVVTASCFYDQNGSRSHA
jgi:glycine cleavage system aminomethyltransferase T/NADPH-dependent 2,4-dienoyl-CoA reductase/sulfur reductase-like enzyme